MKPVSRGLILPCRERLRRGVGSGVGEVIRGCAGGQQRSVDLVADEGVDDLENDIHGEVGCGGGFSKGVCDQLPMFW